MRTMSFYSVKQKDFGTFLIKYYGMVEASSPYFNSVFMKYFKKSDQRMLNSTNFRYNFDIR